MVVVMEAGASVCGEAGGQPPPTPTSSSAAASAAAAANHRWYADQNSAAASAASASAASSSSEQLDAYFKGSNATTAAYFSQMQAGAYPGMSYHGNFISLALKIILMI